MKIINSQDFSSQFDKIGNKAKNLFIAQNYGLNIPKFEVIIEVDLTNNQKLLKVFNSLRSNLKLEPNQKIILRSSATYEDSNTKAFAGIFESTVIDYNFADFKKGLIEILNPTNKKLEAYDKRKNEISIIVQEYKIFTSSGVIFSLNPNKPFNGPLINANFGQPNSVVEGKSSFSIQLNLEGLPVGRLFSLFSKKQVQSLVSNLNLLKSIFQQELDIEFGFEKSTLFILQVRPISAFASNHFSKLDSSNIRENFPVQVLPLTYSILQKVYFQTYYNLLLKSGVKRSLLEYNSFIFKNLLASHQGNLFYNMSNWFAMSQFLPGSKTNNQALKQVISGKTDYTSGTNKFGIIYKLRYFTIVLWKVLTHKFTIKKYQSSTTRLINSFANIDFSRLELNDLNKIFNELEYLGLKDSYVVAENDFLLMNLFDLIKKKLNLSQVEFSQFISANSSLEITSSEYIFSKYRIYEKIEGITKKLKNLNKKELLQVICYDGQYCNLKLEILDYIKVYGARFAQELDLAKENPNPKTVKQFLEEYFSSQQINFNLKKLKEKEKSKLWYISIFNYLVKTREQNRLLRAGFFDVLRSLFTQVGTKLETQKFIENAADIHYLSSDEIWNFINFNSVNLNLKDLVSIRKKQYLKSFEQQLFGMAKFPDFYKTKMPQDLINVKSKDLADRIYGLSVSSGTIKAKITVLKSFPQKLEKSYGIIVTKNTDPGWIEIFPRIKGLILEGGGILSHASIVCRELGIPCITDVTEASIKLKDGQIVELNADQGFIKL